MMDGRETELPLFPLGVVLFPRSALPLHIFEERYKVLIKESIDLRRQFGINLVEEGKISLTGCSAEVMTVLDAFPDGKMNIVVVGKHRYHLERTVASQAPYDVGIVRFLEPPSEELDVRLAEETVGLYNKVLEVVHKGTIEPARLDAIRPDVAFSLAQKSGMTLLQRQELLETGSENERLRMVHDHLEEIMPKLESLDEVMKIVRNDGYIV